MVCFALCLQIFFELTFVWAGEPIVEPEVDLSAFLEKQRISEDVGPSLRIAEAMDYDNDDVDTSLVHVTSKSIGNSAQAASRKGKVEQVVWDEELDTLSREKKAAEATRGEFKKVVILLFSCSTFGIYRPKNTI